MNMLTPISLKTLIPALPIPSLTPVPSSPSTMMGIYDADHGTNRLRKCGPFLSRKFVQWISNINSEEFLNTRLIGLFHPNP